MTKHSTNHNTITYHVTFSLFTDRQYKFYGWSPGNCAAIHRGAWWHNTCHYSNLNGVYNNTADHQGVNWYHCLSWNYSLRFSEMKIRPATF